MADRAEVCIVSMPWAPVRHPQLAVGLLVAAARARGIDCRGVHPCLVLAGRLGAGLYNELADARALQGITEHLFAVQVFGAATLDSDAFIDRCEHDAALPRGARLRHLRDQVIPGFVEETAQRLLALGPRVLGFSCTFQQTMASLAVARRLKALSPGLTTVFGGAAMHGEMGPAFAQDFARWADFVFTGEADTVFPLFLERLLGGAAVADLPGIAQGAAGGTPAPTVCALDQTPMPDFSDFFAEAQALRRAGCGIPPVTELPFESSRGCWWGARHHCSFCGMVQGDLTYRAKSPARVVDEVATLARRHGITRFVAADSILPADAARHLLPALGEMGLDLDFFWEIKANLRRDEVAALAAAGVRHVQPGIESFSDRLLGLLGKGSTALHNVQLLKWASEFGIRADYNLLVGMPGATAEDDQEVARVIRAIQHLAPPSGPAIRVEVHRHSPYFDAPARHGLGTLRPAGHYRHIVPPEIPSPQRHAYFFEQEAQPDEASNSRVAALNLQIEAWTRHLGTRTARLAPGFVSVHRSIGEADVEQVALDPLSSLILVLADSRIGVQRLRERCAALHRAADGPAVDRAVEALVAGGWMLAAGGCVLALAPFARPHRSGELADWLGRWFGAPAGAVDAGCPVGS